MGAAVSARRRTLLSAALLIGACSSPAPEPPAPVEPAVVLPPEPVPVGIEAEGRLGGALVRWRRGDLSVATAAIAVEPRDPRADATVARPDPQYDSAWLDLAPGRYALGLELTDRDGHLVGRDRVEGVVVPEPERPLRFLDLGEDLGLEQPIGLQVLLAFSWPEPDPDESPASALRATVEHFSRQVIETAVGPAQPGDLESLTLFETNRELVLERGAESESERPQLLGHSLGAQALCVVDLGLWGEDMTDAQLGLRLFDVGYRRYQRDQPERPLWNTRLLIFEDHVRIDGLGLADTDPLPALTAAWRELLGQLATDPYVRRYRAFLDRTAEGPLWEEARQRALLELLGQELAESEDDENFETVERDLLFLRTAETGTAPVEPALPVEAAAEDEQP